MGSKVFLGKPSANVEQWIKDHHKPVVKETTVVKYTAESGLPDWEGDIVGELTDNSIPNKSDIAEVAIGSHVTSIGDDAFYGCISLTSVSMPDSVTSIGESAFNWCYNLMNVTISNSVTNIKYRTFYDCSNLTSMTIPDSVISINMHAFTGSRLTSVTFSGKTKATVQGMENYSWLLSSGCVLHCTDGDITLPF